MKCWIERDGKFIVGPGVAELLECIDRTNSIRAAVEELLRGALKVEHFGARKSQFQRQAVSNVFNIKCSQ